MECRISKRLTVPQQGTNYLSSNRMLMGQTTAPGHRGTTANCRLGNMDRETVLRWLPYVSAAKLAEGVPDERDGLLEIIGSSPTIEGPAR